MTAMELIVQQTQPGNNRDKHMKPRRKTVQRRLNEAGQGMSEYILIIGLVALVVFGLVKTFGTDISNLFSKANSQLESVGQ
jgi:Flp pilus assembly pilin Flp